MAKKYTKKKNTTKYVTDSLFVLQFGFTYPHITKKSTSYIKEAHADFNINYKNYK